MMEVLILQETVLQQGRHCSPFVQDSSITQLTWLTWNIKQHKCSFTKK